MIALTPPLLPRLVPTARIAWRHGLVWTWGVLLAVAMFTLSWADCATWGGEPPVAGIGQASVLDDAPTGATSSPAGLCAAPSIAHEGMGQAGDLPDFDLLPVVAAAPGRATCHVWTLAPSAPWRARVAPLPLRPPDA